MEYDNNNRGALWRNETATQENKQPYLSGKCIVNGKELVVAAWRVEASEGKKARFDLRFQEPKSNVSNSDNTSVSATDIPF